jgi:RNA polymerase primary sigma factor
MNDMNSLFKEVGRFPLLTREQEVSLAQKIEGGDRHARDLMIQSNMRLAISIARAYSRTPGVDFEDLVQESTIGLMRAVDRFDWRKGFKFSTYATWWIKQAVRQIMNVQSSSIRLPAGVNNLVWRAKRASDDFHREFGVQPTLTEIADILKVDVESLNVLMQTSKYTLSLDAQVMQGSEDGDSPTLADVIPGTSDIEINEEMDRERFAAAIRRGFSKLTDREEKIIRLRFGISEDPKDHIRYPITHSELLALNAKKGEV